MECGKHDILPVAGAILDHARVPVMLPRQSDADMRRDGSTTAQTVPIPPSMSAEECTAHQDSRAGPGSTRWCSGGRPVSQNSASSDTVENRRRRWPRRERDPRLRGQDKGEWHYFALSDVIPLSAHWVSDSAQSAIVPLWGTAASYRRGFGPCISVVPPRLPGER